MSDRLKLLPESTVLADVMHARETVWVNPAREKAAQATVRIPFMQSDIDDAAQRLTRLAPLVKALFFDTAAQDGIIESRLDAAFSMQKALNPYLKGKLYIKRDDELPIAGSVKARGGIYEVLKYTEDLALANGILKPGDSSLKLLEKESRAFLGRYRIQVGSTGNLGLSIGISGAALGFNVTVHMSSDAREWKKQLLRSHGVTVIEYPTDYTEAVKNGRNQSQQDLYSYFVDDENSAALFLGYAVAARRLGVQLVQKGVTVDKTHPLFVYIPCGVGGAPAGIALGLKLVYGDDVHVFLAEPVQAPCMLLGLATGLMGEISVQDAGLSGKTLADGLAVGRPSALAGSVMRSIVSGVFTVQDRELLRYLRLCHETEAAFLEPSACAGFFGPDKLFEHPSIRQYLEQYSLGQNLENSAHIVWSTGGGMVPQTIRDEYLSMC